MMRNCLCFFLCLIFSLFLPQSAAVARMNALDSVSLPEDTIAIVLSPENSDPCRVLYAVHDITKGEDTLSVSVLQIPTDPQWKIYDADTDGISEAEIRWQYGFPEDLPIWGSYCEAYLANGQGDWIYCKQDSSVPDGSQLDERFTFLLSEIMGDDEKCILQLTYGSIATPGTIDASPLCLLTIDLSAYLNAID